MYGAYISSGMGILEACRVAGISMCFSEQVVRRWAKGGLCSSVEDATDERLERELESG